MPVAALCKACGEQPSYHNDRCKACDEAYRLSRHGLCPHCGKRPIWSRGACLTCQKQIRLRQAMEDILEGDPVTKQDLLDILDEHIDELRTVRNVLASWQRTSLHARDPHVIVGQKLLRILGRSLSEGRMRYVLFEVNKGASANDRITYSYERDAT